MFDEKISVKQKIKEALMVDIEELDLSWNQINKLPIEIGNLKKLRKLDLSNNHLSTLPPEIGSLTNLEYLNLKNNRLTEITPELKNLKNLKQLILKKNEIKIFPDNIDKLNKLQILDLQNNKIREIPNEIGNLKNLEILDLTLNPILNIPKEIIERGAKAIVNYFHAMKNSQQFDYLYEAKLLLVGRGGRGKTSIMRKLKDINYALEDDIISTEGIDIKEWYLDVKLEKSNKFRFNLWDFAGQEKYNATHQFFLTRRSLYLFVTDARQEDNYLDFDYWLNIIKLRSNGSPVIIVQNKIDERYKELPSQKYKELFPNIHAFVKVSCKNGFEDTIKGLIREIKKSINKLPQIGDELPKSWVDIRNQLEEMSKNGVDFVSYQDYLNLCNKFELDEQQALILSQYYNDLGIIVHHQDDLILRNTVIVNPDWVVDGVYSVLDTDVVQKRKGKFADKDLIEIWKGEEYKDKRSELLQLMKNYELCFEFGNSKTYIAPELLLPNPPLYNFFKDEKVLNFQYHYEFMPSGIITRFIVRIHQHIYRDYFWRYGVLLDYEESMAEIIEDEINRKIKVRIFGKARKELLGIIRLEFKAIHKTFHGLDVKEMVALDENGQHFKSYEEIRVHAEINRPVFSYELRKEFDPKAILEGIMESGLNKTTLRRKVARGELDTVFKDIYRVYSDNNIVVAQLGRLNELRTQINLGIISQDERKLEENKLRLSLLELIDYL